MVEFSVEDVLMSDNGVWIAVSHYIYDGEDDDDNPISVRFMILSCGVLMRNEKQSFSRKDIVSAMKKKKLHPCRFLSQGMCGSLFLSFEKDRENTQLFFLKGDKNKAVISCVTPDPDQERKRYIQKEHRGDNSWGRESLWVFAEHEYKQELARFEPEG